jgi:hypothetical protein
VSARDEILVGLDHDDLLAKAFLAEVGKAFDAHPEAVFVHSNTALITEDGKPDDTRHRRGLLALDLGAPHQKPPGYLDVDQYPGEGVAVAATLPGRLDLPDSSVGLTPAVDFVEHVPAKVPLINELYRLQGTGQRVPRLRARDRGQVPGVAARQLLPDRVALRQEHLLRGRQPHRHEVGRRTVRRTTAGPTVQYAPEAEGALCNRSGFTGRLIAFAGRLVRSQPSET